MFHTVMYPYFLLTSVGATIYSRFRSISLCIAYPFLPITNPLLYWAAISISCIGLLYVQFMQVLYQHCRDTPRRKEKSHRKHNCNNQPYLMFAKQHSILILKSFLVFRGVQLYQHLVGWLAKTGKHFLGFMDSMHNIGCNTTLI